MDANTIGAIIGILGIIISTYFSLRKKTKTKIFFFQKQLLKLYADLTQNIPGLEITFKGKPVLANMFVVKGVFICSGDNDITKSDIDKGITLTIDGKDAKWHTFEITSKTKDFKCTFSTSGPELVIDFPMLMDKDYFILEALGECEKLRVDITHRISNVPPVEERVVGIEENLREALSTLVTVLIGLFGTLYIISLNLNKNNLEPTYYNAKKEIVPEYNAYDTATKIIVPADLHGTDSVFYLLKNTRYTPIRYASLLKDSLSKVARKEYSTRELITGQTKLYKAGDDNFISFRLHIGWGDYLFLLPLILFLYFAILLIRDILITNRTIKVSIQATKLLN